MKPFGLSAYRLAKEIDVPVDLELAEIEVDDQIVARVQPRAA